MVRLIRNGLMALGTITLLGIVAAGMGLPNRALKMMAADAAPYSAECDYIVLLPGGGIPSGTMLMRSWQAAVEYQKNRDAKIIITLKAEPPLESSTIWAIRNELIVRGVPKNKIILEKRATNTAEHARFIKEQHIGDPERDSYLIVTSPSHIPRSVMVFRAQGFRHIYAASAGSRSIKGDLGGGITMRYDIWNSLKKEITLFRELVAILYYKFYGYA